MNLFNFGATSRPAQAARLSSATDLCSARLRSTDNCTQFRLERPIDSANVFGELD
jgi:hypothetical protein